MRVRVGVGHRVMVSVLVLVLISAVTVGFQDVPTVDTPWHVDEAFVSKGRPPAIVWVCVCVWMGVRVCVCPIR